MGGSIGGSSGKTTTTQTSTPWGPQQGYLQQIFNQAQSIYANEPGGLNAAFSSPVSPLLNSYIDAAVQNYSGGVPGGQDTINALYSGLNAPNSVSPWSQGLASIATNPDYLGGLGGILNTGAQQNSAIPYIGSVQQDIGDQSAAVLQNAWDLPSQVANNQYIGALGNAAGAGLSNPALAQLQQSASGAYLTPDTNPYLKQAVQTALDQAQSTIASQFNQGGRYGSGMMAGTEAKQLGDIANTAYSNAYEQERQNQLAAQQALGSQYLTGAGQLQNALGAAGQLTQGQQSLGLNAFQQIANAEQQRAAQELSAGQLASGISEQDLARNLAAQQFATQSQLQAQQNAMQGYSQALQGTLQGLGLQQNTLQGSLPTYQGMQSNNLANLMNAAQVQQQTLQMPEQNAWNNLANYLAMVQGSYGGTGTTQTPYYTNQAGSALGGAIGGGVLGSMLMPGVGTGVGAGLGGLMSFFSSRTMKRREAPADVDAVASGVIGLPIDTWTYNNDSSTLHIGPYAEDFAAAFGVGDGRTISVIDAFGVLFATVQHLLSRTAELEARLEELEDVV